MSNFTINEDLRKALTTSSSTTGDKLINTLFTRELHTLILRDTPILNRIPHINWGLPVYNYRQQLTDPAAFSLADNENLPASGHTTYDRKSAVVKYHYNLAEVSGPLQYATAEWFDALANEIDSAGFGLGRYLEQQVIFGDSAVNIKQFDGILKQITTNDPDAADENFTLSTINGWLNLTKGKPTTMVASQAFMIRMIAMLQAQVRYVDTQTIDGGIGVVSYRGLPIIQLDNEINATWGDDVVVMFDHRKVKYINHRSTFLEKLAKTKDADAFLLGTYSTVVVEDENWHATKITSVGVEVD